jgi:hypothetical protein
VRAALHRAGIQQGQHDHPPIVSALAENIMTAVISIDIVSPLDVEQMI